MNGAPSPRTPPSARPCWAKGRQSEISVVRPCRRHPLDCGQDRAIKETDISYGKAESTEQRTTGREQDLGDSQVRRDKLAARKAEGRIPSSRTKLT